MSVDTILRENGVTAEAAYEFILDNLSAPSRIYSAAGDVGLNVDDLTELVARFDSSVEGTDVRNYFANAGLEPSAMVEQSDDPSSTDEATDQSTSNIRTDAEGRLIVAPEEPLTDDQKLFLGGLEEAKTVSLTFVSDEDDSIVESTPQGYLFNVAFGDEDFADVIFDISSNALEAVDDYIDPVMDQVQVEAYQRSGVTREEIGEIYNAAVNGGGLTDEQGADFIAFREAQQSIIDPVIQPMYEALIAGESEIWG